MFIAHPRYTADWETITSYRPSDGLSVSNHEPCANSTFAPNSAAFSTGCIQSTDADVGCANIGINAFKRDGHGNGAAARSQIPHAALRWQAFEHGFHQMLGFRAWNQHMGIDGKTSSVELAFAQQIGHRLAFQTAFAPKVSKVCIADSAKIVRTACHQLRARVPSAYCNNIRASFWAVPIGATIHPSVIFRPICQRCGFLSLLLPANVPMEATANAAYHNKILYRSARYPMYSLLRRRVRLSH